MNTPKIAEVRVETFHHRTLVARDSHGIRHPASERDATQTLLRIRTDDGSEGYCFGADAEAVDQVVRPILLGEDPFFRERLWQRLSRVQRLQRSLSDRTLAAVDMALWDLAGRRLGEPVHRLLGASRDAVPAYASTMCGDDLEGGLDTPEAYARFAEACRRRGYRAFKLHTWQPPVPGAPDPRRDVAACRAVRERVGDEMTLMLDPYHFYDRDQALYIGKEIERLGFHWFEEPMDEHATSSYVWLAERLEIPILGPESVEGKLQSRAEWIARGASDRSRGGVWELGGITPLIKAVHLAEAFGLRFEVHLGGVGNLHVLCAMGIAGEYYERGLLHPMLDYETPPPWLKEPVDPMDDDGLVHVSPKPGLGMEIDFDYVAAHRLDGPATAIVDLGRARRVDGLPSAPSGNGGRRSPAAEKRVGS
jgi:L-alanine-DL-glutamate epimerase-like enolase superfamily enzyme